MKWNGRKINKYGNKQTTYDGIKFDSLKEGNRYLELKLLERNGDIIDLNLQVKFELQPSFRLNNKTECAITYVADFVYTENGETIVEDVKAFDKMKNKFITTEAFNIKRKMLLFKYTDIKFRMV